MTRQLDQQIFISPWPCDSSAKALCKALGERGLRASWVEAEDNGSQIARKLEHALRSAGGYIVLVSKDALTSPNVNSEIGAAMGGKKKSSARVPVPKCARKVRAPLKGFGGIQVEGLTPKADADRVAQAIQRKAA
jgi:hypothetical protein